MAETTRRTFLQSMATAFGAAAFGIQMPRLIVPPPIRYDLFTDDVTMCKYDLTAPWSKDGAIYATDARFLITHPGEWTGDAASKVPDVGKLPWDEFDEPGWKEMPEQRMELRRDDMGSMCHHCLGLGRVGEGVHRVLGVDEDGDPCYEWAGGTKCPHCKGKIWDSDFPHYERLGPAVFCPARMNRLRTLGGLDYRVIETGSEGVVGNQPGPHYVLLIRGDNGIRGMLMSMTE